MKDMLKIKTIRERISLFFLVTIVFAVLLAASIVSWVINDQMAKNYAIDKEAAIESLSESLVPPLQLYDYKQIERIITSSLSYQNIAHVGVQNKEGVLIVSATEQGVSLDELDVVEHLLTSDGFMVGSFEVGFSKTYINRQIQTTTGALVSGLMGFFLLLGLALFGFINQQVSQPLGKFTKTISGIDSEHLSSRVKIKSRDEIGTLAANFNRMAGDLETAYRALEKAHDELEVKIRERTAELNQRNQELATANLHLEDLSRHKSQFLANMSHELRTPLNSIIGYTKLILNGLEGDINEEQKKDLQAVYNNGKSLLELINGLLDLSKIEAGKMVLSYEVFPISDLLAEVTTTVEPLVKEKGLTLLRSIALGIDSLYADRAKTRQVLINILGNAIKFTPKGHIKLNVFEDESDYVFSVTDSGIGIKKESLEVIFDSFVQVGPAQIAGYAGTGLGLAVCKQFIEMQGGKIWAESELGQGSKFIFTLPKKKVIDI
jgi:signal transduction histidine kinase